MHQLPRIQLIFEASKHIQARRHRRVEGDVDLQEESCSCKFAYKEDVLERLNERSTDLPQQAPGSPGHMCATHLWGYRLSATQAKGQLVVLCWPTAASCCIGCPSTPIPPPERRCGLRGHAIHKAGVKHRDLDAGNHNGRPMIIDFEDAENHGCEVGLPIAGDATEPSWEEFNCPELYELCGTSNF
ncbi:hypothetical protein EWM64_g10716 [Hericium alpestre]|uniref:Protein kinase domain-containing protein n=1 Tax=Hericium alpestre TaxID=135208 RepID=A0A4Y9ZET2_9AGAM|nr:hypothetical protein EWM64_g10716 [Hericium alpestre]